MEKTGFTPGPWNSLRRSVSDRAIVCAENQPLDICVLSNRDKTIAEVNANARLIAAAPELYEALKEAQERIALSIGDYNGILGRIEAALSKAEG